MKPPAALKSLSIKEAQIGLERAVRKFVNRAEWVNPYSVYGIKYRSRINDLRIPLAELHLAKLKDKHSEKLKP